MTLDAKIKFVCHSSEKLGVKVLSFPYHSDFRHKIIPNSGPTRSITLRATHKGRFLSFSPLQGYWLLCDSSDICSHIRLRAFALLYPILCAPSPPGYLHGLFPPHVLFFFQVSHSQWALPNYITLNLCPSLFCSIFPQNAHYYLMSTYTAYLLSTSLD